MPEDKTTHKPTKNLNDNYLLGKSQTEIYRFDDKGTLAIYFPKGQSTTNVVLPQFDELSVKYKLHIDCEEKVYLVSEDDIHKIHSVLKFQIKGKNDQFKIYKEKLKKNI